MALVLIAEPLDASACEILEAAGHEVSQGVVGDAELSRCEALLVRSATTVDQALLDAAPLLRVVARAGVGVDNVDLAEASRRGIVVLNAPDANVVSAAEHTLALILAVTRQVPAADASLRSGAWERTRFQGTELYGKTLGLVGLGRVGSLVAERAIAFGMNVIAHDQFVSAERAARTGVQLDSLEAVVAAADVLSLHVPRTPETVNLVNAELLARMKPTSFVVNTSRGGVVDEEALAAAIEAGSIAGAAIDVFVEEPATTSPLFHCARTVVTPHLGASTLEAQRRASLSVAHDVVRVLRGELVPSAVNVPLASVEPAVQAALPHVAELGRLAAEVARGDISDVTVEVTGRLSEHDPTALILAATCGLLRQTTDGPVSFVSAAREAERRGWTFTRAATPTGRSGARITIGRHTVAAELDGDCPRLLDVDGYRLDLPLTTPMLLLRHRDVPGVLGSVGCTLGDAAVNIDNLHVAHGPESEALTALTTRADLAGETLELLRSISDVRGIRYLAALP